MENGEEERKKQVFEETNTSMVRMLRKSKSDAVNNKRKGTYLIKLGERKGSRIARFIEVEVVIERDCSGC